MSNNPSEEIVDSYFVLKNCEEQYSLWPSCKDVPFFWEITFGPMPKEDCLKYVNETWIDMRPLSLRKEMDHNLIE